MNSVKRWYRAHERGLAAAWLIGSAVFVVGLLFPPTRDAFLRRLQAGVDWWDDRWIRRLDEGERLLAAGRAAEAQQFLAQLDREFPARDMRHRRDKARERLLIMLGRAEAAAGRRDSSLAAYSRLVKFDSLNYLNYFEQARALAADTTTATRGRDAFAKALRMMPSHLPSLRGYVQYAVAHADFATVADGYQRYLDAYLVNPIEVRFRDSTTLVSIEIDGRSKVVVLALACPDGCSGPLTIGTDGFSTVVDSVVLIPARHVGDHGASPPVRLSLADLKTTDFDSVGLNRYRARSQTAKLELMVPPQPNGIVQIKLGLRLFKPVDEPLWNQVADSYRKTGRADQLASAEQRTVRQATPADADLVLARLEWVREGRMLKGNERAF